MFGRQLRVATLATVVAVTAGVGLQAPASASDHPKAHSRFISGDIAGIDVSPFAALKGVSAGPRAGRTVTHANTLKASLFGHVFDLKQYAPKLDLGKAVTVGGVTQFAQARPNGDARAYTGLIGSNGAFGDHGGGVPRSASINLSALMRGRVPDVVTDQVRNLRVRFRGLSAVAAVDGGRRTAPAMTCRNLDKPRHCLGYQLGNVSVSVQLPAMRDFYQRLDPIWSAFNGKSQRLDQLCGRLLADVPQVGQACGMLAGNPLLQVRVTPPSADRLLDVFTRAAARQGLKLDPRTGKVSVDADRFLAGIGVDINDLGPDTNVLHYVTETIDHALAPRLNAAAQRVIDEAIAEVEKSAITVQGAGMPPITAHLRDASPLYLPLVYTFKSAVTEAIFGGVEQATSQVLPALRQADSYSDRLAVHANIRKTPRPGVHSVTALQVKIHQAAEPFGANINIATAGIGGR